MSRKLPDADRKASTSPESKSIDPVHLSRATKSLRRVLSELQQITRLIRILGIGRFDTDPAIRHLDQSAWDDVQFSVTQAMPAVEALGRLAADCDRALSDFGIVRKFLINTRSDSYELKTVPDIDASYGVPFVGASAHHVAAKIARHFRDTLIKDESGAIRVIEAKAPGTRWAIEFRKQLRQKGVRQVRRRLAQGEAIAMQVITFWLTWQVLDRLKVDLSLESRKVSAAKTVRTASTSKRPGLCELTLQRTMDGGLFVVGDRSWPLTVRQYWVLKCIADARQNSTTGGFITRKALAAAFARLPPESSSGRRAPGKNRAWITKTLDRIGLPEDVLERDRRHERSWRLAGSVKVT
jgi:hypothetical protein